MSVASLYQSVMGNIILQKPLLLWWILPALIIVIYLIHRSFVDVREDSYSTQRRRRARKAMTVTRAIIIILIVLAFAGPARIEDRTVQSDPFVKLLVDNSSSMGIFEMSGLDTLEDNLAGKVALKTARIANGENSAFGETLLSNLKKGDNVLLVTDGQTTGGPALGDIALFAASNNITLSLLRLPITRSDAWVSIDGASKTASGVDSTFTVTVGTIGRIDSVKLKVTVDGKSILDTTAGPGTQTIVQKFTEGTHKIIATIDSQDAFKDNNEFYKSVKAVAKPKVFMWTLKDNPPLLQLLTQVYDVTTGMALPSAIDNFYAIIINDIPGSDIALDTTQELNTFVTDGGGMLVVGGPDSYDRGQYGISPIKNLLPVNIGSPGRDLGDVNVVVLIDASQSSGAGEGSGITISRQLTLGLINDLDPKTRIGVVAFQSQAEIVSPLAYKSQAGDLIDNVQRLQGMGSSNMADGIQKSLEMLRTAQGNKNLVIVSDGLLLSQIAAESRTLVQEAFQEGVKVYTIGAAVGDEAFIQDRVDEDFMKELATISHGIYFRADTASRLKLIFNPPKDEAKKNDTDRQAVIMDSNHFITQNFLFKDAKITGFNAILPKTSGTLLATLSSGEPLLVVWRLGLGRVATLATDDGTNWAGPLLTKDNSPMILRTLNWAIGDPDRKEKNRVDVEDGNVNEPLTIYVSTDTPPVTKETTFVRIGENTYQGSLTPQQTGFVSVLGATAAVNGPLEYKQLGENKALERAVATTDGRFFSTSAADAIAEFAKSKSLQVVREEVPLLWPLAITVFIIWLIELIIRRILGKS